MDDAALDAAYRGRRVCVTGGAGFIGSHLAAALARRGADVAVLDDFSNGLETNLEGVPAQVLRGSILEPDALAEATAGAEVIFHQAALASVPRSLEEPERYERVNVLGTMRVLEAARATSARRVVFAASSSIYGDGPGQPRHEAMTPDPRSPYAASKGAGEMLVAAWAHGFGRSGVSLRYFNVFGPRQRPDSPYAAVIPIFAAALRAGERPTIFGDGEQTRDFTYVDNVVRANLLAGATPRELKGEAINVACGAACSLNALLREIADLLGVAAEAEHAEPRAGDVRHSLADVSRAAELLGYAPEIDLREGLARTLAWFAGLDA